EEIRGLPRAGLPDYRAIVGPRCRSVWLVTVGGEQVGNDPVALPAQAALASMHRCAGFEFPDQTFVHLDLPSGCIDGDTARVCVAAVRGNAIDVAVRGPLRYIRGLRERRQLPPERPLDDAAL